MPGKGKPFEPGNKKGKGGSRQGAGRKTNWFKELCEDELEKNKAAGTRLIGEIYRGEAEFEKAALNKFGVVKYKLKPGAMEVIAAGEFLRDSSQGRPAQAKPSSAKLAIDIFDLIRQAEEERGLPSSFDD